MKKWKKAVPILFCFIISFLVLLFTSKCSPLYPLNDWVDANAFFTVGKSMMNGLTPYTDIFEQKGLFLYLIYGIGYLISHTSFLGVFLLEVIFFTVFLYYIFKIFMLFVKSEYAYLFIPLIAAILCTSRAFVHGGGAEEFCLPFLGISLYYFLRHYKGKKLNYKEICLNGLCAGLVLMTKYTLLGFWFAWMAMIFFDFIFQKKYKKAFVSCIAFLLGMFTPFLLSIFYMLICGNVKDFFHVYFYLNMTAYGKMDISLLEKIITLFGGYTYELIENSFFYLFVLFLFPLWACLLPINKRGKASLIVVYLFTILGIFYGLKFYRYYIFPIFIFIIIFFIVLSIFLEKHLSKVYVYAGITASIIFSIFLSYNEANYKEFRDVKKEDLFQYQYAEILKEKEDPTLVNLGYLDCGLYTTTGIVPSTYFFELQNFSYDRFPDNIDAFMKYIEEQKTDYIIYFTRLDEEELEENLYQKYELIEKRDQEFEHKTYHAYLFEKRS